MIANLAMALQRDDVGLAVLRVTVIELFLDPALLKTASSSTSQ